MKEKPNNYIFKLNVQPHILKQYYGNMKNLKNNIIPDAIFNSYSSIFYSPEMSDKNLILDIEQDYQTILESSDYQLLIRQTEELAIEYRNITDIFKKGGGIHYVPEYLAKLENAIDLRKEVVYKFKVLNQANFTVTTSQAYEEIEHIYDFSIDSEIGKGLDHLRRVRKIIIYLELELQKNRKNIRARYSFDNEVFTIENVTKYEAVDISKKIERQINDSKSSIGDVKINPIYGNVVLNIKETMATIEIITTYPNGNTDDELDILLQVSEETSSKEVRTVLVASDSIDNSDFFDGVNKVITIPGKRGYLSDIRNNGTTIINIYESTIEIE